MTLFWLALAFFVGALCGVALCGVALMAALAVSARCDDEDERDAVA